MADNLGWETVILVLVGRWCTHTPSMAHQAGADKPLNKFDNALQTATKNKKTWYLVAFPISRLTAMVSLASALDIIKL
jgi:hypothetical protein